MAFPHYIYIYIYTYIGPPGPGPPPSSLSKRARRLGLMRAVKQENHISPTVCTGEDPLFKEAEGTQAHDSACKGLIRLRQQPSMLMCRHQRHHRAATKHAHVCKNDRTRSHLTGSPSSFRQVLMHL